MKSNLFLMCFLSAFTTGSVYAQIPQQIYFNRIDVPVTDGTKQLPNAWCGGMNNPQFSVADLNRDGTKDLVIYEQDIGVKTFINYGVNGNPKYVYDGANYEHLFPANMFSFVILKDYNKDNVPDLFHGGGAGFEVYIGKYVNNKLNFTYYKGLRFTTPSGMSNPSPGGNDIPAIVDIDNDGDLDFFSYTWSGNRVGFYKNCTSENGLPKDSISICLKDECWGKYVAGNIRTMDLQEKCDNKGTTCKGCSASSSNKTTHVGNALCLLDYDGDGDFDLLHGHNGLPDLNLLTNGKNNVSNPSTQVDSFISQDTIWSSNGKTCTIDIFPAAFAIDINQDGRQDIMISPHEKGTENYKTAWYFKNTATTGAPKFVFQTDTYLVDDMIDLGSKSYPVFYDYNRDGKPDLFVGNHGYYQAGSGKYKTQVAYFENTSTKGNPSFKLVTKDFNNIGNNVTGGAAVTFGDVNADGKDDMVIGHRDGTMSYYLNNANDNISQPQWSATGQKVLTPGASIIKITGGYAAPILYDVDTDGRPDLVVASALGVLKYFHNESSTGKVAFLGKVENYGGIKIKQDGYYESFITPYIGPVDNTGTLYLVLGSFLGNMYLYDCPDKGNPNAKFKLITDKYQYFQPGRFSVPAFADVDSDGKYELVVGNELGGVMLYRQIFETSIDEHKIEKSQVRIYPNPASNTLKLEWAKSFSNTDVNVTLINATGQKMIQTTAAEGETEIVLDISSLPAGMYYSVTSSPENRAVNGVSIVK